LRLVWRQLHRIGPPQGLSSGSSQGDRNLPFPPQSRVQSPRRARSRSEQARYGPAAPVPLGARRFPFALMVALSSDLAIPLPTRGALALSSVPAVFTGVRLPLTRRSNGGSWPHKRPESGDVG